VRTTPVCRLDHVRRETPSVSWPIDIGAMPRRHSGSVLRRRLFDLSPHRVRTSPRTLRIFNSSSSSAGASSSSRRPRSATTRTPTRLASQKHLAEQAKSDCARGRWRAAMACPKQTTIVLEKNVDRLPTTVQRRHEKHLQTQRFRPRVRRNDHFQWLPALLPLYVGEFPSLICHNAPKSGGPIEAPSWSPP
jgi:hypothetical protein